MTIATSAEWQALTAHRDRTHGATLSDLFASDPDRGARLTVGADGLWLDYSKARVTDETLALLVALAEAVGLRRRIDAMFAGQHVNVTEDRPALHVALRAPEGARFVVDGADVVPAVHAVLRHMSGIASAVRDGRWLGHTGRPVRAVVNLGIGGSHLGPAMAVDALTPYCHPEVIVRFVSNVDGADLQQAIAGLEPATTLFVVASKTFTTVETMTNARTARAWLLDALGADADLRRHLVAVSANVEAAVEFGVDRANVLEMWDWVGGRYSLDSAIGLPLMVAVGEDHFRALLAGFHAMDEHFRTAPFAANLPALLALVGIWHGNFLGAASHAVVPYSHHLARFPAYLQQLEMESNGKRTALDGTPVAVDTAPVVWGTPGTDGQHAYFQLLHQGTRLVPCDVIGFARAHDELDDHQRLLMANCFAQTQALAFGRTAEEVAADGVPAAQVPHRTFPGNRPTNTLIARTLSPFVLGQLIAAYEHKVFVQGVVWDIDSFDQWGVELGKTLATALATELEQARPGAPSAQDSSTRTLLERYRVLRGTDTNDHETDPESSPESSPESRR